MKKIRTLLKYFSRISVMKGLACEELQLPDLKQLLNLIISPLFLLGAGNALAQPTLSFELKKPPKFENRTLASEKTGNKKFTVPRWFMQNTVTHYNYFFNANN